MLGILVQLLVVLSLLLWADRWLHRHLQGLMLLLTGDREIALWLYAIVLLPGVVLHELSHALVAKLVGVKIGRINILPQRTGRRIQLGFVPVEDTDFLRASLIGAAPLVFGSSAVVAIGYLIFGTPEIIAALTTGDWLVGLEELARVARAPDVWVWGYLVFAIGNTMLPSRSDIHAWPTLAFVGVLVAGVVIFLGGTTLLLNGLGRFLTLAARWMILLGASTLLVDVPVFLVIFLIQKMLEYLKGVRLEYE
ncbi:MAG: hypothetical protein ACP5JG_08035 [Anaerolineae bacterium]